MTKETVGSLKYTITNIFVALVVQNRYYAGVISKMAKIPTKEIDTLAVSFNRFGKIVLLYNPDFVNGLTLQEAIACLTHEALHVFFRHLLRFDMKNATPKMRSIMNWAVDIAINQYIPNLPLGVAKFDKKTMTMVQKGLLYPETFNFEKDKTAEWYLDELLKLLKDKDPKNGEGEEGEEGDEKGNGKGNSKQKPQGDGTLDEHSTWGKVFDEGEDGKQEGKFKEAGEFDIDPEYELNKFIKEVVKDMTLQKGDLPAWMQRELDAIKAEKRHDWKRTLKIFVNSMLAVSKRLTQKRNNRRFVDFDYILPGKKKNKKPRILVARDTSGSMADEATQQELLNEMIHISKHCDMYVVDCDTIIHQDYKVKKVSDFKTYKGGGGTSFVPVFEFAKKKNFEGVIYLTDTYGDFPKTEDVLKKLLHKTIWVTFDMDEEKVKLPFGKHLNISTKK